MSDTLPMLEFSPGDIVACWGRDFVSRKISLFTSSLRGPRELRWAPSHVAIIGKFNGQAAWYESTSMCPHPCQASGEIRDGFQVHYPYTRANDYIESGGTVRVYRPTPLAGAAMDETLLNRLLKTALEMQLSYSYAGALLSGTKLVKHSRWVPTVDQVDVFCSEILHSLLAHMGMANHADPRHFPPGALLRMLVRTGVYQLSQEAR